MHSCLVNREQVKILVQDSDKFFKLSKILDILEELWKIKIAFVNKFKGDNSGMFGTFRSQTPFFCFTFQR